jgi:signal transduction histidine kinase
LRSAEAIASQVAFAIDRRRDAESLEALMKERTASLHEAIDQMQEFSYSMSHDLRSPLRAMRAYAEALLEDHGNGLDTQGRQLLQRIVSSGARMDQLIQDLLNYSRVSRRDMQMKAITLDPLVQELIEQYPEFDPSRADIEIVGQLGTVLAHEPSLTQVLANLFSNGVKFVRPGTRPRLRVRSERDRAPGRLRVWVEDNGIGIKPEYQKRIFGIFERLHNDREFEGTGIGLAIVRKAVERMNGSVGVESDGIDGSRFWIELPLPSS